MIEILEGFPANVIAAIVKGRLTRSDYDDVLIPKAEAILSEHAKARCYYEVSSQFTGVDADAAWEDFKLGAKYRSRWERVAIVTDVEWIRHAVEAFRFLIPGEIRIFPTSRSTDARDWIRAE